MFQRRNEFFGNSDES